MSDLDSFALNAYARGVHPIDHAQMRLRVALDVHAEERTLPPHEMAGFVLGELLAAGWLPPGGLFPDTIPDEMSHP